MGFFLVSIRRIDLIEYVGVYKGRSLLQDKIQAVPIFAAELKFTERATQSGHQQCRAGERRPR